VAPALAAAVAQPALQPEPVPDRAFAARALFAAPTTDDQSTARARSATTETAGVQAAATSNRASIRVQIVTAITEVAGAVAQMLPPTGGPAPLGVALGLGGLGALGLWLRALDRRRRP
jgi:hypothetical protein